jgi:hypothetical protein
MSATQETRSPEIVWQEAYEYFTHNSGNYDTHVHYEGHDIELSITSSAGGNQEGGFEETVLITDLPANYNFNFEIHPDDFLQTLAKFFGAQDVKVGFKEFDDKLIVKANNESRVRELFQESSVREAFQNLSGFSFGIVVKEHKPRLRFKIQHAILDFNELATVFDAFAKVLVALVKNPSL